MSDLKSLLYGYARGQATYETVIAALEVAADSAPGARANLREELDAARAGGLLRDDEYDGLCIALQGPSPPDSVPDAPQSPAPADDFDDERTDFGLFKLRGDEDQTQRNVRAMQRTQAEEEADDEVTAINPRKDKPRD